MIVWEPRLELGVGVLDTQHRHLVAIANEVITTTRTRASEAAVLAKLRALTDYATRHFEFEEELMAKTAYQDRAGHAEHHSQLLGHLERVVERMKADWKDPRHSARTHGFLRAWITWHILLSDRHLAAHLIHRSSDPIPTLISETVNS